MVVAGGAHPRPPRGDARGGRRRDRARPAPDEVYVLNDPFTGGTHLPDITLVSRRRCGFACSRAHHADVGGTEPGSLPAGSRTSTEEGVVHPADATRRGDARRARRARCATRTSAAATCARSSPPIGSPSAGSPSSSRGGVARRVTAAMDGCSATRSASSARRSALPDGRYEARRRARGPARAARDRGAVTIAGD